MSPNGARHKPQTAVFLVHGIGEPEPGAFLDQFRAGLGRLLGNDRTTEIERRDPADSSRCIHAAAVDFGFALGWVFIENGGFQWYGRLFFRSAVLFFASIALLIALYVPVWAKRVARVSVARWWRRCICDNRYDGFSGRSCHSRSSEMSALMS